MRQQLRQAFASTLQALDPRRCVALFDDKLRRMAQHPLLVIAIGKAARGMAEGLLACVPDAKIRGLLVPLEPDTAPLPPFEVIPGGHPLPTAGSLRAASRALELVRSATTEERLLFLVSGGGSAMLELPADPAVTLEELRTLYRALVGCGADIAAINTVRRRLSSTKDGRLAAAAPPTSQLLTMAISDVRLDASATLASGPTMPTEVSTEQCRAVLDRFALWPAVPPTLRTALEHDALPAPPSFFEIGRRSEFCLLSDSRHAVHRLRRWAETSGMLVVEDHRVDDWPYERAAAHLLHRLERLRRRHPGRVVAVVTGGELSVPLPATPGIGGRNQQFALACARLIRGRAITVMSCGTDGIDGNSPAAGAIVDGTTMWRARKAGFHVHEHLRRCDAFPLLHAIGDTVITGPTGTNVRDVRVLLAGR